MGVSGAIQRLTSLESTVAGVSGAIQRLPSLEESFRRATDRIKELSESSQQEKDALYAKQEQVLNPRWPCFQHPAGVRSFVF